MLLIAAVLVVVASRRLDTELYRYVYAELQKKYPHLEIVLDDVQLVENKGIMIRGLELRDKDSVTDRPVLQIDEVYVDCPISLKSYLNNDVKIHSVTLRRPLVNLTRSIDGKINELETLYPKASSNKIDFVTKIIDGTICYSDENRRDERIIRVDNVMAEITPPSQTIQTTYNKTEDKTSDVADVTNNVTNTNADPTSNFWKIRATSKSAFVQQLDVSGYVDTTNNVWQLSGVVRQLEWFPELLTFLPFGREKIPNEKMLQTLETFAGRIDFGFKVASAAERPFGVKFDVDGFLSQAHVTLKHVNKMFTQLNGHFLCTDDSIVFDNVTASNDSARLTINYRQEGLFNIRKATLTASARDMDIDSSVVQHIIPFLPPSPAKLVSRFEVEGRADIESSFYWNGRGWTVNRIDLVGRKASFNYLDFPYQASNLSGKLSFATEQNQPPKFTFDFETGLGDTPQLRIIGEYDNLLVQPSGMTTVRGVGITINQKLLAMLPENYRNIVNQFSPKGSVNAVFEIVAPRNGQPLKRTLQIGLDNCEIVYENFKYPLREIYGMIRMENDSWDFRDICGRNETANIQLSGHFLPTNNPHSGGQQQFLLHVKVNGLPIDGQILTALPNDNHREIIRRIGAKGKVNIDNAFIVFIPATKRLNISFDAEPCAGFSVCPIDFPYQFENVTGKIHYHDNGTVQIEKFRGENGDAVFNSGFLCNFAPDGSWRIRLDPITIDQLPPNRELQNAMPPNLRAISERLAFEGPVNMSGVIEFSKLVSQNSVMRTTWDLGIILHRNSAVLGLPVRNIFGKLYLSGINEASDLRISGSLDLKTMNINGFQLTDITGPFYYDGSKNIIELGKVGPSPNIQPFQSNGNIPIQIEQTTLFRGQNGDGNSNMTNGLQPSLPTFDQNGLPLRQRPSEMPMVLDPFRSGTALMAAVPRANDGVAYPMTGHIFDGKLTMTGQVSVGRSFSYDLTTQFDGGELAKVAVELGGGQSKVSGKLYGAANIHGEGNKMETLSGKGWMALRDAYLYDVPFMMKILQVISIGEPEASAFSAADIEFKIQGKRAILDPVIFEGTTLTLKGNNGELSLDNQKVDIMLGAYLGNRRSQIPVISNILGKVGEQVVGLRIDGPLNGPPSVTRIPFPSLQQSLQTPVEETTVQKPEKTNKFRFWEQ